MRLIFAVLLIACGGEDKPEILKSSPQSSSGGGPVAMDVGTVHRPDGKAVLTASQLRLEDLEPWLPDLKSLAATEVEVLLNGVNRTTAACEPCMTEGMSLGSCLKRDAAKCPVLVDLLKRAFRVAIQGGDLVELQRNVGLVEPWQSVPRFQGETRSEVLVTYAVDYLDPFSHRAWAPWEELLGEYGEAIDVQFLQIPHARHPGAETIAQLALQAASVGRSLEFHREVLALGENPEPDAVAKLGSLQDTTVLPSGALEEHRRISEGLDVDSTPIVWINGYRLTGVRQLALLQHYVDLALADLDGTRP